MSITTMSENVELLDPPKKQRRKRKIKEMRQCLVCGDSVLHRHFGESTCCSATFFRRAISQQRSYFCRQSEACKVDARRHKNRCSYCRFAKCLEIGMDMTKVVSSGIVGQTQKLTNNTVLGTLQKHHNANFTFRRKFSIQLYGVYKNMWEETRTAKSFIQSTEVERLVINEFLRNIGAIDQSKFDTEYETELCSQMLPLWMLLEIVFTTRLHSGHRTRKLYYVDDSYLDFNEDKLLEFYNSHTDIFNSSILARACMPLYKDYFKLIELIHRLSIDESERMALTAICIYRRCILISGSNPRMQEMINMLFKDLKNYYDSIFNSMSIRFGQLMLCVEAVEEAHVQIVRTVDNRFIEFKAPGSKLLFCFLL